MTRKTNARIAGLTYLVYIAVAYPSIVITDRATKGSDIAEKLATVTQNASDLRLSIILGFLSCMCALVLAVTLYAITRDEDPEIALLGLLCRAGEGIFGAIGIPLTLGLLLVAAGEHASTGASAGLYPLADFVVKAGEWSVLVSASFFAVGSTLFSYLLLRGRIVPAPIAALGFAGSLIIAIGLPVEMAGFFSGSLTDLMWIPVGGFEILVALWLIFKGARMPRVAKPSSEYDLAR